MEKEVININYEATFNGDKQELYLDSYHKKNNELLKVTF